MSELKPKAGAKEGLRGEGAIERIERRLVVAGHGSDDEAADGEGQGIVAAGFDGAAGMVQGGVAHIRVQATPQVALLMAPGEVAMRSCVIGFEPDGILEQGQRALGIAGHGQGGIGQGPQVEIVGIVTVRTAAACPLDLGTPEVGLDRPHDVHGEFVLEPENVVERAVVVVGPDKSGGLSVDELAAQPEMVSNPPHTAVEQVAYAQFLPDNSSLRCPPFVDHRRVVRDDQQPLDPAEAGGDFGHHAVGEVILSRIRREVREGQHGNGGAGRGGEWDR